MESVCVSRLPLNGERRKLQRLLQIGGMVRIIVEVSRRPERQMVGVHVLRSGPPRTLHFSGADLGRNPADDIFGDALLNIEDVFDDTIERVAPELCPAR